MDTSSRPPEASSGSGTVEGADANRDTAEVRTLRLFRGLSLFAALLAFIEARAGHSLTSLAFVVLAVGLAAGLVRDRAWPLVIGLAGAALAIAVGDIIGLS